MNYCKQLSALGMALALGLTSGIANAVAITDVTFRILPADYQNADAAALLSGNDNTGNVNALTGLFSGDAWTLLDKTDGPSALFNDVTFTLTGDVAATSGEWGLSWSGTGLPLVMDFVFVTKAARNWGAYLFDEMELTSSPNTGDGTFTISWTNNGGEIPGLSHASIYGRLGSTIPDPDPGPEPDPLPVPGTLMLLALGLITLVRRRSA